MKRKLLLLFVALAFSGFTIAQSTNSFGQKNLSIKQTHGPTVVVPISEPGSTRAVVDDCTNPIIVSIPAAAPYSDVSQTNCGRGNSYSSTCLGSYDGGEDIIYRLDVTADGTLDISMDPKGTTWTGILIADDCPDIGTCLDYNTGSSGTRTMTDVAVTAGNSYYIMVDTWPSPTCISDFDLTISYTAPPTCPDPTAQSETNKTTSGADLGWTDASGSYWDIYVVATGGAAPTQTTIPTANDVDATQNPYTWSGGSAATTYDWYVRSDCDQDNTGTSAWVGPSTFTTACSTFTVPFSEDFTSTSSTPNCWSNDSIENWLFSTSADYGASSAGDHTTGGGTNYAWIDGSSGVGANALITPYIDASSLTTPLFEFYYFSNNTNNPGDDNTLYVDFWDGASWNNLLTYASDSSNWILGSYDLSSYSITGDVQFRFYVEGTATTTYNNDILVDDISLKEMPSCPDPTDQTESTYTTSGADLGWTDASGSHWDIYVVATGGTAPIQTTTPTANDVTTTPYTWAGGTSGTTYDWYVRSDCDQDNTGTSTWVGPSTFNTSCPAKVTSFPYTADFENAGSIQNCWTNDPSDAGGEWKFRTSNSHGPSADHTSGTGYYALLDDYLIHSYNSPFNLLTPTFDLSTHNKWYKVSYWAWIGPDGDSNPIYFEVSLDGGTTWNTLYTHDHSTTSSWFNVSIDLGFNKSDNVVFRFRGMSIYGYSTDNSGIDDFTIEETQAPPVPLSDWAVYIGVAFMLLFLVVGFRRRWA